MFQWRSIHPRLIHYCDTTSGCPVLLEIRWPLREACFEGSHVDAVVFCLVSRVHVYMFCDRYVLLSLSIACIRSFFFCCCLFVSVVNSAGWPVESRFLLRVGHVNFANTTSASPRICGIRQRRLNSTTPTLPWRSAYLDGRNLGLAPTSHELLFKTFLPLFFILGFCVWFVSCVVCFNLFVIISFFSTATGFVEIVFVC